MHKETERIIMTWVALTVLGLILIVGHCGCEVLPAGNASATATPGGGPVTQAPSADSSAVKGEWVTTYDTDVWANRLLIVFNLGAAWLMSRHYGYWKQRAKRLNGQKPVPAGDIVSRLVVSEQAIAGVCADRQADRDEIDRELAHKASRAQAMEIDQAVTENRERIEKLEAGRQV